MKFSALREFLEVAECGSLRAAARHLGSTQPTISRNIHDLERELGVVLFERHTKGVQLTPMGEVFLRRASAALNELRRAQEELGQICGETSWRIKFSALHEFLEVAKCGSLRAAARHLGSTQPTISRNIHDLERELGVVLFERHTKGVQLTPMGEVFLRRASAALNELRRAQEELGQICGETSGRVVAAFSSVSHVALLPNALQPFRARFPNVQLDLIDALYPGIENDLRDGAVDFYTGPVPKDITSDIAVEKLIDNTRVVVGRKGHPLAKACSLRDLLGAEWITAITMRKIDEEIGLLFAKYDLPPPRVAVQTHSAFTSLIALAYTDLLMVLPVRWVNSVMWSNLLQIIPVKELLPAPPICLAYRNSLPLTPAAEYFCDMIRRASKHMDTLV